MSIHKCLHVLWLLQASLVNVTLGLVQWVKDAFPTHPSVLQRIVQQLPWSQLPAFVIPPCVYLDISVQPRLHPVFHWTVVQVGSFWRRNVFAGVESPCVLRDKCAQDISPGVTTHSHVLILAQPLKHACVGLITTFVPLDKLALIPLERALNSFTHKIQYYLNLIDLNWCLLNFIDLFPIKIVGVFYWYMYK